MRTLVVSDFHLGARLQRDVLRSRAVLETLLDALAMSTASSCSGTSSSCSRVASARLAKDLLAPSRAARMPAIPRLELSRRHAPLTGLRRC